MWCFPPALLLLAFRRSLQKKALDWSFPFMQNHAVKVCLYWERNKIISMKRTGNGSHALRLRKDAFNKYPHVMVFQCQWVRLFNLLKWMWMKTIYRSYFLFHWIKQEENENQLNKWNLKTCCKGICSSLVLWEIITDSLTV